MARGGTVAVEFGLRDGNSASEILSLLCCEHVDATTSVRRIAQNEASLWRDGLPTGMGRMARSRSGYAAPQASAHSCRGAIPHAVDHSALLVVGQTRSAR